MIFSNIYLVLVPPIVIFWYEYVDFALLSLFIGIASNFYHYAYNAAEIEAAFGVGVTGFVADIIYWPLSVNTQLFFQFTDYCFANLGVILYTTILSPRKRYKDVWMFVFLGFIIFIFGLGITGSINSPTAEPPNISWLSLIILAYLLYVWLIHVFHYRLTVDAAICNYYRANFHLVLLYISFAWLITGLIFWCIIQMLFPSFYFWAHGTWHLCVANGQIFLVLSLAYKVGSIYSKPYTTSLSKL